MTDLNEVCYDDTPIIPGTDYRVHGVRPEPPIITPPTPSTQEAPGNPPSDAKILFDGTDLSGWESVKDGSAAGWKVEGCHMEVVPRTGDIKTKDVFGDCQLHIEWAAPAEVNGDSQGRGNSGVFLMGLYEIQVLDCYNNPTYPDGQAGALYGQCPPLVNACREPGEWQTYDILWEAPRFEGDELKRPAYVTVLHNGVMLHHHKELMGPTQHKQTACYEPHPAVGPLQLQDHGDLVRYRNIWVRTHTEYDKS